MSSITLAFSRASFSSAVIPNTRRVARVGHRLFCAPTSCHSSRRNNSSTTKNRAIIFTKPGNPSEVISAVSFPALPAPAAGTLNVRFLLSPINPSDINVIEGVYPTKPLPYKPLSQDGEEQVYIPGNEALARVTEVGSGVSGLKEGDWVVMTRPQSGTWSTGKNLSERDVLKVTKPTENDELTDVHLATITVNPPTAYNVLRDFVDLKEGDWIVQNGANSAVGQAVIQIAAARGIKTLNFVRNRDNIDELVHRLERLGASKVLTYDALADKSMRDKIKEWTGGQSIKLGLNCVGGKDTSLMTRLLGVDGHLVSYGAMSKQPLTFPTSLFIFKNLKSHGFWQNRWYEEHGRQERQELVDALVTLSQQGKLKAPEHEVVTLHADKSDLEIEDQVKEILKKVSSGHHGKKVILRFE